MKSILYSMPFSLKIYIMQPFWLWQPELKIFTFVFTKVFTEKISHIFGQVKTHSDESMAVSKFIWKLVLHFSVYFPHTGFDKCCSTVISNILSIGYIFINPFRGWDKSNETNFLIVLSCLKILFNKKLLD